MTEEKLGPDPEVVLAELDAVDMELALVTHQEQLPAVVLQAFGMDSDTMRVLTPEELIQVMATQLFNIFFVLVRVYFQAPICFY